jgi:NitT/TauT family transport system substrate-binding protein
MRGRYLLLAALLAFSPCGAAAEPVKITNIGHGYFSGPLYIAKQEKLFEKHGLEPDVTYVQGGALALQSVLTKQVDVGILSYEHVLTAAVQGKQIVSFFNVANRPVNNIIANAKLVAASAKLGIGEKVALLKGGRVGVPSPNGSGEKMLKVLAKKFSLTLPGDITMAYLGAEAPAYVAAFQKDLVDAALPFEPAGTMVEQTGKGAILLNLMSGEVPEFRDLIFISLTAHPDTIAQKPDLLRKVARVFAEAQRLLKTDPKRGKALMAKEYPTMTPESNDRVYDIVSQIWPLDPRMSDQQARAVFAYLQPEGPHPVDYSKTFTNAFIPN